MRGARVSGGGNVTQRARRLWTQVASGFYMVAPTRYPGDADYRHEQTGRVVTVYTTDRAFHLLPLEVKSLRALLRLRGVRLAGTFRRR